MKKLVLFLWLASAACAGPPSWDAFQFLVGEWEGTGTGKPGEGAGGFAFSLDLERHVLVRRNHAEYPAQGGRPAAHHEDLMVVDQRPGGPHATYWDNEGHAIDYAVTAAADRWIFVSPAVSGAPRFRLTYTRADADHLQLRFEIAPPGKPDVFSTYIEAGARRRFGK